MKNQKRSRLFRALICSSAAVGMASQATGQDGVAKLASQPPQPDPVNGADGVASTADQGDQDSGVAQVPSYTLPEYIPPTSSGYQPPARRTWQDELGPRYLLETRIGEWLGTDDNGESAVNVILPFSFGRSNTVMFVDGRGTVSWDGEAVGSIGGGVRYYDEFRNRITGLSTFYDYDDGPARSQDQIGISFESMGRWVDFRANGYIGLGDDTQILDTALTGNIVPGPVLQAEATQRIETQYSGFNVELGGPTPLLGRYGFDTYVGAYHYDTDDAEDFTGVSVRMEASVTDDLRLGINVTHDDVFDTQVYGTAVLTLPDGRPDQWFRPRPVSDKILDRVERRYRVVSDQSARTTTIPVTTMMLPPMGGGQNGPISISNLIVVDPEADTNGSGTFDDPFNTFIGIPDPSPNTLTLVRSGNVEGQHNLSGNSLLLSEAFLNQQMVMVTTPLGPLTLPALDPNATIPVWSNTAGNTPGTAIVNILGDNTEIAGFIFDGRTNTGLPNDIIQASGVQGVSIHDNTFRNFRTGINLQNVTGEIEAGLPTQIFSNVFYGNTGKSFTAFNLENNGQGTLDLEFGETGFNLASSNGSATGNFAFGNTGEDANGNGVLDAGEDTNGNFQLDTGSAFSITARNRAIINARLHRNIAGVETDTDGDGELDTEDLNRNGMLDPGEDTNGNGELDFGEDVNQNGRFDIGSGTGFVINAGATQSVINLSMIENIADSNIGEGILLTTNASTINASEIGEDVNGNGMLDGSEDLNRNGLLDFGEDLDRDGMLDVSEDLNGNGMLDPGEDVDEDVNDNGVLDPGEDLNGDGQLNLGDGDGELDLLDEDINNNGMLDGFEDFNLNGRLDLGEDENEDTNNNGQLDSGEDVNNDGFLNQGDEDGFLDGGFLIAGNTVTNNGGDGIRVESTNNARVDLRVLSNSIGNLNDRSAGNQGIGINMQADSGTFNADLGFLRFEDVNFNGVLDAGEDTNANGVLDSPLASDGNQIIANAGGGVNFDLTGTAEGQITAIGNTLLGSGGGRLGFTVIGDPAAMVPFDTADTPFDMINASDVGIDITEIFWNLAPAGIVTETANSPFSVANGSDVTTGLESVNGDTTLPFDVADQTGNVEFVFDSFNPINNQLDPGEDTDGDGVLGPGEDMPDTFSFVLNLQQPGAATNAVTPTDLLDSRIDVTFSTGQQVTGLLQQDPANASQAIFVADSTSLPAATGLNIDVADNSTLLPSLVLNNQISNFGGDGVSVTTSNAGTVEDILVRGNTINQNFGHGIHFESNGASAGLTASVINNQDVTSNTLGGIRAAASGGRLVLNDIMANDLTGGGSGISLLATQSGDLSARITGNDISTSMMMNGSTGNGVEVTADGATITLLELAENIISNNAGDGVVIEALNEGAVDVPPSEDVNGNDQLDPGEDNDEDVNMNGVLDPGEDTNTDGFLNTGNGNGRLDRGIINNNINNNAGDSFTVNATSQSAVRPSTVDLSNVSGNQILFNTAGTGGFALNGVNSRISGTFIDNIITGNPTTNPTAGPGFLMESQGGVFDITVGGPDPEDGNSISQVRGAGIAFVMTGAGDGSFVIRNNDITGVVDDADDTTPFEGDGISVSLIGSDDVPASTATLTRSEISDNVIGDFTNTNLGTEGSGVAVVAAEDTTVQDLLIARNMIGNPGVDNDAVTPFEAGIRVIRLDDARFDAVNPRTGDQRAVTIDGNVVRGNSAATSVIHGLFLNIMNGIRDDIEFDVRDNEFSGFTGDGIRLNTQADASLATDLTGNLIEDNGLNGIHMTGVEIVATDLETQGGTWSRNIIRNNANDGIFVESVSGTVIPLIIGLNGNDPLTGESLGNLIEGNGGDGIDIDAGGSVQINNNVIARNGGIGIDIDVVNNSRVALVQNNSITQNAGDGFEVLARSVNGFSSDATIVALGNSIDNNGGRGVDLLNAGNSTLNVRFGDDTAAGMNRITSNGEEGFYVVNTSDENQTQDVSSSVALLSGGAVNRRPDMVLDIRRNIISANNNDNVGNAFDGGGLVIRAGTSLAGDDFFGATQTDSTGDIFGDGSGFGLQGPGVGANNALFGNGRINARVTNNTFDGNLGDDVFIRSFVSTVDPATGAAWDAMMFDPMGFESDPLARLNLVFRGNTGNSLEVANVGAFHNNGDGVFKSRLNMMMPPGPFTSATRRRNAQRVPLRGTLPPAAGNSPDNGQFQFPGMGASTFRIEGDFDTSGFQSGDTFLIDGSPIPPFSNANGVFPAGAIFGEQPFGWGEATPGTFEFDPAFQGIAP